MAVDYLLQQDGNRFELEDASGYLILDELQLGPGECGVEQETDTDLVVLEDGTGLVLLETCPAPPSTGPSVGGRTDEHELLRRIARNDDETVALVAALL